MAALEALVHQLTRTDIAAAALFLALLGLVARSRRNRHRVRTTKLKEPKGASTFFGLFPSLIRAENSAELVDGWVAETGLAFVLSTVLFAKPIIFLADLKATAHFLAKDTFVYRQMTLSKIFIDNLFGEGILSAEEEDHRRQRKALTPAFTLTATRGYLSTFYDSAYKIKSGWEALLDNGSKTIEVQSWMNFASLDNIGIVGMNHNFGALEGKKPEVVKIFEAFEDAGNSSWASQLLFLLGPLFPPLQQLPTKHNRMMKGIKASMATVADALIQGAKEPLVDEQKITDRSIMGLLLKAEMASEGVSMSKKEILAQNTMLFAGYETTSIALTWALIELCSHPEKQEALREELSQYRSSDPSWDQLSGLPYLNGVVQETLRLHPPVLAAFRTASEDDVIPLSKPVTIANGDIVSEIIVAKGTSLVCSFAFLNQSEEVWGPDGKEFKPERWVDDTLSAKARTIQGYHHLMTFSDGPRFCLGRNFAIANFKATLSVLIRNFMFELPDGAGTKIGTHKGILDRPKVEGEVGPQVPLVVRLVD